MTYLPTGASDKVEILHFNDDGTAEAIVTPAGPIVVHEGRYRLYKKPDGGLHIVYQRTDKDDPDHMDIPGPLLALAQAAGEGKLSPTDLFREVMKMRNGAVLYVSRETWPGSWYGRPNGT